MVDDAERKRIKANYGEAIVYETGVQTVYKSVRVLLIADYDGSHIYYLRLHFFSKQA